MVSIHLIYITRFYDISLIVQMNQLEKKLFKGYTIEKEVKKISAFTTKEYCVDHGVLRSDS